MIGYVTLGTNDKKRAEQFFDELMKEIGVGRILETDQFTAWGSSMDHPGISVTRPYDGKPASIGNGTMVAFQMKTPEEVTRFYDKAIALGGTDEGPPGRRGEEGFYAAYFRDPDGHKFNAFCFVEPIKKGE